MASAGTWSSGLRLQNSIGHDSNALETLEARRRQGDEFLRILGEGSLALADLPYGFGAELNVRAFLERYSTQPREDRAHGEARLAWESRGPGFENRTRFEFGLGARDYPDSSSRNYARGFGRIATGLKLGSHGVLVPRLEYWTLDFRRTLRRDEIGRRLDLTYERRIRTWLVLEEGVELGGVHHGLHALKLVSRDPDQIPELDLNTSDRRDSYRLAHVSLRLLRRGLIRVEYAYCSQGSNSMDAALRRHEFRWLASHPLPLRLVGQFYGNLEHTTRTDRDLGRVVVLQSGEREAGEDDNTIALRLSRSIGRHWTLEARHAWYRNESLLIGNFYSKRVLTAGLSWESGTLSGF
jgi:hypothetical protein